MGGECGRGEVGGWECYGDGGSGKVKEGMLKGVEEEGRGGSG